MAMAYENLVELAIRQLEQLVRSESVLDGDELLELVDTLNGLVLSLTD